MPGPEFPSKIIGCDGECGFVRRGGGWECSEGSRCGRFIAPGDTGYDEITAYYEYWNNVDEKMDEAKKLKMSYKNSSELNQKGLRAKDHIVCEKTVAATIINAWAHENNLDGFIRTNSVVMKDLRRRIERHIRRAYERGQKSRT